MSAADPAPSDTIERFLDEVRTTSPSQYSLELKILIARFRSAPLAGKLVIVELEAHRRWIVGRLPGRHGAPVELLREDVFDDRAAIERRILEMRLLEHARAEQA